ncbi:DUF4811 domain-containing protein [Companilactobacillus metriopterae]|uniref:DUF4811 domain-containing protein n=1 Tax=Companilactobacillus metriopterae TaxID=1909267 RepID=UPI00100B2A5C|nr:DUF4811 domain-containing protein [Companilactobacillus metriopterae]
MVLVIILASVLISYYFAVYVKNKKVGYSVASLFILVLIGSLSLLVANEYSHFGMEQKTTSTTEDIHPVQSGMNVLIYKQVGTSGKENVYVYKTSKDKHSKDTSHTKVDVNVTNKVKYGTYENPKLTKKTTHWVYKNDFYKLLFGIANNDNEFVKQTNTFYIDKSWATMSTDEAKQLQKMMGSKEVQAQSKEQGEAYVKAALAKAMQANPSMTPDQQKQVISDAQAQYQASALKQALKTIRSK